MIIKRNKNIKHVMNTHTQNHFLYMLCITNIQYILGSANNLE